jgi:hypothetical protein
LTRYLERAERGWKLEERHGQLEELDWRMHHAMVLYLASAKPKEIAERVPGGLSKAYRLITQGRAYLELDTPPDSEALRLPSV